MDKYNGNLISDLRYWADVGRQHRLRDKVVRILRDQGISMPVYACSCCDSHKVSFRYRGETIVDDEHEFCFVMDGESTVIAT